jgi:molecular chaperone HtpG
VAGLRKAHEEQQDDPDLAKIVYGMALLADGGELADPSSFVRLLAGRLATTL